MSTPHPDSATLKRGLVELATTFRSSAVLFAALELDVFAAIPDQGAWPEALGQAVGVDPRRLRLLLNGLAAMGLLTCQEGRFSVHPALAALLRRGPGSFGSYLLAHKREVENLLGLATTLRGGDVGARFGDDLRRPEILSSYLSYVEDASAAWSAPLAERLGALVPQGGRMLIVGGAYGSCIRPLLDLNAALTITVLDEQAALAHCRARHESAPYAGRLEFAVGDPRTHALQDAFDLVLIDNVLHYLAWEDKSEVVQRACRAARPGCRLALLKLRLDANGIDPPGSSVFSLKMLAITGGGYQESDAEAVALFGRAGARDIEVIRLTEHHTVLIGAR